MNLTIGGRLISESGPVFIIAEIGINHNGRLSIAKRLIDAAVEAGADCVKLQMRNLSSLYVNAGKVDDFRENLGSQYTIDLLSRFELSTKEMFEAFDYCKKRGILPLCTPWDIESLKRLEKYGINAYKVASADMTNHYLLRAMALTKKPLIVSTGMSSEKEIKQTVSLLKKLGVSYVLMHCNSTYPAPFKDLNLNYLKRLGTIGDCLVGYSGHERGFHIPIAAVSLGAKVIEKHITLDRNMEGSDHKVSLLPDEFKQMVKLIREVEESLGSQKPRQISQGEMVNRASLAKSLVAKRSIKLGEKITEEMVEVKSPGRGLQPNYIRDLVGRAAKRDLRRGDFFFPSDLKQGSVKAKTYSFKRPWGIPVRFHDFKRLISGTNPDFVEFHLTYKDMDLDIGQFFDKKYDIGLVVHSPDLFAGDHILDLASGNEDHRKRSIRELQRVVEITRKLKKYFRNTENTKIIASLGGFGESAFSDKSEQKEMYKRVSDSLSKIDEEGVEIVAQTLPPFPWYFGGQYYLNLFVNAKDTAEFCASYGRRLCLDISHSKLASNYFQFSFKEYIDTVAPYIAHIHVSDSIGVDGEGLQIGEGDVDFPKLAKQLEKVAPSASFIAEIWQGHENNGEGFWIALGKLEKFFAQRNAKINGKGVNK